jgi:hypothetical protein
MIQSAEDSEAAVQKLMFKINVALFVATIAIAKIGSFNYFFFYAIFQTFFFIFSFKCITC